MTDAADRLLRSRAELYQGRPPVIEPRAADEGGCGVTAFACSIPVRGRHIYEPSRQMHNRGNGKGGGVAAVGLVPEDVGVSQEILDSNYLLQIALLDPSEQAHVDREHIHPVFDVALAMRVPALDDYRDVPGLEVRPPDVHRYLVRVKPDVLQAFAEKNGISDLPPRDIEDEFVFRNSARLNETFYSSLGEKKAFVLSHGRNLIVFKIVGYAEQIVQYYQLEDLHAHVWIAHQRYPTKGRVWHPGGAHPFVGLNEALVHNGDFANYHSVSEYLAGRNLFPRFLTDTEVSVLLFDLWNRVYKYPLEYIIEALAPTTELDFARLPAEKQRIYRQIQAAHMHGSPDGPWFFIIARSLAETGEFQLMGITDTAMLRPQVFALQEGEVSIGLICSEKQAIDATLASLAGEDKRFTPLADQYWNARGGSHTDGGAFLLTVSPSNGNLRVTDKFGNPVSTPKGQVHCDLSAGSRQQAAGSGQIINHQSSIINREDEAAIQTAVKEEDAKSLFAYLRDRVEEMDHHRLRWFVDLVVDQTAGREPALGIDALTLALDRRYPTGRKKRSSLLAILRGGLEKIFNAQPLCGTETKRGQGPFFFSSPKKKSYPLFFFFVLSGNTL